MMHVGGLETRRASEKLGAGKGKSADCEQSASNGCGKKERGGGKSSFLGRRQKRIRIGWSVCSGRGGAGKNYNTGRSPEKKKWGQGRGFSYIHAQRGGDREEGMLIAIKHETDILQV